MRSDSDRQMAYQQRRLEKEARMTFWLSRDIEQLTDGLRKAESRAAWVNRAITTLTYMQLLGIRFTDIISDEQAEKARKRAKEEFGVNLP